MAGRALTTQAIERCIHLIRGHKVMLDADLARLYGVDTKRLNEAVKRNRERFPEDFMFRLTAGEAAALRSQIATSNVRGGRRYLPYAFTQEGVAMLSSVLNSKQAIAVNIEIVRVFVRLRHALAANAELARQLADLEQRVGARLSEHDQQLRVVFEAIRQLMVEDEGEQKSKIGFEIGRHR